MVFVIRFIFCLLFDCYYKIEEWLFTMCIPIISFVYFSLFHSSLYFLFESFILSRKRKTW